MKLCPIIATTLPTPSVVEYSVYPKKPKYGEGHGWPIVPDARESKPKAKSMTRVPWEAVADFHSGWWYGGQMSDAYSEKHIMDIGI